MEQKVPTEPADIIALLTSLGVDHRELAGHGDSGALDTAPFGDGDTPSPKA